METGEKKYWVNIRKSKTNSFIFFESEATLTSETYFIDANTPKAKPVLLSERSEGHFYTVFDGGDRFLIKTNLKAENYRLMELDFNRPSIKSWKEVMPHREDVLLETIEQFKEYIVFREETTNRFYIEEVERNRVNVHLKKIEDDKEWADIVRFCKAAGFLSIASETKHAN